MKYCWPKGAAWDADPEVVEAHFIPPDVMDTHARSKYPYPEWSFVVGDCECKQPEIARKRMERILGQPGIPDECFAFSLDDFAHAPHARKAWQYASAFVGQDTIYGEDGSVRTGLLLAGSPGSGKTTLGSIIFRLRVQAGQAGCWCKFTDVVAKVRATYEADYHGPSVASIRDMLTYSRFLMIDDLGSITRGDTTYAEDMIEFMFLVIDHRLAKHLPTLLTINLSGAQLEAQFGGPIASRLHGLCHVVIMEGIDFRRQRVPVAAAVPFYGDREDDE